MFNVPADRKAAQLALADATMSISFQSAFNVVKVRSPARMDVPDTAFDMCGKKGNRRREGRQTADGKFVGSMAQELRPTALGRRRLSRPSSPSSSMARSRAPTPPWPNSTRRSTPPMIGWLPSRSRGRAGVGSSRWCSGAAPP